MLMSSSSGIFSAPLSQSSNWKPSLNLSNPALPVSLNFVGSLCRKRVDRGVTGSPFESCCK